MNDYIYQYLMEDKNRKIESINQHAWKYKTHYESRPIFSARRLLGLLFNIR